MLQRAVPGPAEGAVNAEIVSAILGVANGYSTMAVAARAGNTIGFNRGRQAVSAHDRALGAALGQLSRFGYRTSV